MSIPRSTPSTGIALSPSSPALAFPRASAISNASFLLFGFCTGTDCDLSAAPFSVLFSFPALMPAALAFPRAIAISKASLRFFGADAFSSSPLDFPMTSVGFIVYIQDIQCTQMYHRSTYLTVVYPPKTMFSKLSITGQESQLTRPDNHESP